MYVHVVIEVSSLHEETGTGLLSALNSRSTQEVNCTPLGLEDPYGPNVLLPVGSRVRDLYQLPGGTP